jgi:hypothetical protein
MIREAAAPIPEPPPVINATLPATLFMSADFMLGFDRTRECR